MAFVYILNSSSGRFYIGSTTDVERRLVQHVSGHTHTTKRMGELKLVFKQEYATLRDARYIEQRLKKLRNRGYIEKIVREGHINITPP